MARKPRYRIAGVTQLITQRGINGQAVFFSDKDYIYYLNILNETAIKEECQIHAFVLMSNKIHILATPVTLDGISQLMKVVGQRYVSYINKIEKRSGTLWDGRYKASLIEGDHHYLLDCMRYIESTPVHLDVVKTLKDYYWSSYQANTQGTDVGVKITPHNSYISLVPFINKSNKEIRASYKQLFKEQLNEAELQRIQKATNSNIIYGSKEFQENINSRV